MPEFRSWQDFHNFERTVRDKFRFVWPSEVDDFLQSVLVTAQKRRVVLKEGLVTWRAQLGHGWRTEGDGEGSFEVPCAYPPVRMRPLPDRAHDGRANPKGIPCLYLATKEETAISEVRPWIGSYLSVGQFQLLKPIEIIDCSRYHSDTKFYFKEPSKEEIEKAVWTAIDCAFSTPMMRSDDVADYVPTQIIAEAFKKAGLGGIAYKSNFGANGFNVALFDPQAADLINCNLYRIDDIKFSFSEHDNRYFVSRYYPALRSEKAEAPIDASEQK